MSHGNNTLQLVPAGLLFLVLGSGCAYTAKSSPENCSPDQGSCLETSPQLRVSDAEKERRTRRTRNPIPSQAVRPSSPP